jgi:aminoglycoside phosphotransferase (APT) family kinase protein
MEHAYAALMDRRVADRELPAYSARDTAEVAEALHVFFASERPGSLVEGVRRMGGGASKEQFFFTLTGADGIAHGYVMRMDPLAGINETDRRREYEVLNAMQGLVPAPRPIWLDPDGAQFGQPAVIMEFVAGVTKPSEGSHKVSGLGTSLGDRLRGLLKQQFLDHLVTIHAFDWRNADLPSYEAPTDDPKQAARWSFNYWRRIWEIAKSEERPIFSLATQWLGENLPECRELVLTHGDYRTGNYLFDESTGRITAILDWELARIGDFHEDLAWVLMQLFGVIENGIFRASDLYEREEFITAYERASGRTVDRRVLHYYDLMASWKCYIIIASGLQVARDQHNHQDVLMTFLAAAGVVFAGDFCRLLPMADAA